MPFRDAGKIRRGLDLGAAKAKARFAATFSQGCNSNSNSNSTRLEDSRRSIVDASVSLVPPYGAVSCDGTSTCSYDSIASTVSESKYGKRKRHIRKQRENVYLTLFLAASFLVFVFVGGFYYFSLSSVAILPFPSSLSSPFTMAKVKSPLLRRLHRVLRFSKTLAPQEDLWAQLDQLNQHIIRNNHLQEPRFLSPVMFVPLTHDNDEEDDQQSLMAQRGGHNHRDAHYVSGQFSHHGIFFHVSRRQTKMAWEDEWKTIQNIREIGGESPVPSGVDYTQSDLYRYPSLQVDPSINDETPVPLPTLGQLFGKWPQDAIDRPPTQADLDNGDETMKIQETLQHFDFTNPIEMEAAHRYRELELPFKLVNVPEILKASRRWTDDFLVQQFDGTTDRAHGKAQESPDNFFAFFQPQAWNVAGGMGLPPMRNNDWTFETWAEHARYADAAQLDADQPHFYWQAQSVSTEEHNLFVNKDLPSFSSPTPTFISPNPAEAKGIQCRFGERGVTAALHFDAGQNMVGMVTGAKRYILLPPNQCDKLNIMVQREHPSFRHSLINYGHMNARNDQDNNMHVMSSLEREWLLRGASAKAVETVLKAGEVLFIPSFWFHYIIGLQKNAQCNVRSGVGVGNTFFGGQKDISAEQCHPM